MWGVENTDEFEKWWNTLSEIEQIDSATKLAIRDGIKNLFL